MFQNKCGSGLLTTTGSKVTQSHHTHLQMVPSGLWRHPSFSSVSEIPSVLLPFGSSSSLRYCIISCYEGLSESATVSGLGPEDTPPAFVFESVDKVDRGGLTSTDELDQFSSPSEDWKNPQLHRPLQRNNHRTDDQRNMGWSLAQNHQMRII